MSNEEKTESAFDMLEAIRGHCTECENCAAGYKDASLSPDYLCAIDDTMRILKPGYDKPDETPDSE